MDKRLQAEIWEIQALLYIGIGYYIGGFWGKVMIVWGIITIISSVVKTYQALQQKKE